MTSKFWTWTKGDPRAKEAAEALRAGGVVSIPVDCITITGMDHARHLKGKHRKPLPLSLGAAEDMTHSSRTANSFMLQDAAVQSATSLMAAMSDMLRSPHLSAHLSAHQNSTGLLPVYGRPRSHTAPSTPLVEAPLKDPVELPGSTSFDKPPVSSLRPLGDEKIMPDLVNSSTQAAFGRQIERPHSSPQASTYPPVGLYETLESTARDPQSCAAVQSSKSRRNTSPQYAPSSLTNSIPDRMRYDTPNDQESSLPAPTANRPTLSVVQKWPSKSPSIPGSTDLSQLGSRQTLPQLIPPMASGTLPASEPTQQAGSELALIEQISRMRLAHESHLQSLKECHEKELESNRSYLNYLEQRCSGSTTAHNGTKHILAIDTSHIVARGESTLWDTSATTIQSFETSIEHQKRTSQEAYAEVEALKRKLSLCHKAQAEYGDIRRERDHFRESSERSERRIVQLKDIIRKAKDNEKALKNATVDLEARLISANIERIDVLEGFHEVCSCVDLLTRREHDFRKEIDELQSRAFYSSGRHASDTALIQPGKKLLSLQERHVSACATTSDEYLQQRVQNLEGALRERETEFREMQLKLAEKLRTCPEQHVKHDLQSAKVAELEISLADQKAMIKAVQADKAVILAECAKYNSILHAELRRQSRNAASNALSSSKTPNLETEVSAAVAEKIQSAKSSWLLGTAKLEDANAALEKELQHCIQEIILYKLDIKGYKKDLKAARERLESLESAAMRPPTPERDPESLVKSAVPGGKVSLSDVSPTTGLGIAYAQPSSTPTRFVESSSASSSSLCLESFSPRTRTPLSTHKKLPKPPPPQSTEPAVTQLPQVSALHRAETIRSVSESIISSYAKRSPVPHNLGSLPQVAAGTLTKSKSALDLARGL